MDRRYEDDRISTRDSDVMERRTFLTRGGTIIGTAVLTTFFGRRALAAVQHRYKLAPESLLPSDIRQAASEVREAYRFAIANREILRYIPCYCGCVADGHTSNSSCYLKDSSTLGNLTFDRMSLN